MGGTVRNSRPERRVGTLLAGRYRLDRLVANGGMAQVWEASDETLRRRVAVKILHDHLADPATVARFRAEGVTAARLTHPGVVSIFDTCSDDGLDAIVMEYVDGHTLRDMLDRERRLAPEQAIDIAVQIADALAAAHRLGLIHRDVKPANVLVRPDGSVKVTDFGIAKVRDEGGDLTLPGTFLGTAKYLSPEQVEGRPVDARSDVYALGIVLYEMLSGTVPFDGPTDAAIALARVQRDPRPLHEVAPDVPPALAAVVGRAMARRPEDRYAGMVELRVALTAVDLSARAPGPLTHHADRTVIQPRSDRSGFVESERRWLIPAVFVAVVAVSLSVAAVLIGQSDTGQQIVRRAREAVGVGDAGPTTDPPIASRVLPIAAAASFDPPPGDNDEHDSELRFLADGDPTTTWSTEGYERRDFGIKPGVGVYVDIGAEHDIDTVAISSPTNGWAASIHVASEPASTLEGWGPPVAQSAGVAAGDASFDLDGATGRYVLVWITDLGEGAPARFEIGELSVIGA